MLRVSGQSVHSWPDVQCSNAPQLTWTLWPAYHGLQGRWQQAGTGDLGPAQAKDQSVCLWLPGFHQRPDKVGSAEIKQWCPINHARGQQHWLCGGAWGEQSANSYAPFYFGGRKAAFVSLHGVFEPVCKLSEFLWWGHAMWWLGQERKNFLNLNRKRQENLILNIEILVHPM